MSNQVWKYEIGFTSRHEIPGDGKVVHVGLDPSGQPCIWVEVNPEAEGVVRRFEIIGTGHKISDNITHLGSFVKGPFVGHIYEVL